MLAWKRSDLAEVVLGVVERTVTSPEAWSVTMMSGSPSPLKSPVAMADGAVPAATVIGAAKRPARSGGRW